MILRKDIWRTYLVDVLLLIALFSLGVFAKLKLADFFAQVDVYKSQIQSLEPELANQSTSALLTLEPMVADFSRMVWLAYVVIVFVVPLVVYLLLSLSQSVNISSLYSKVRWKNVGKAVLFGLPLLAVFFVVENFVASSFVGFLDSYTGLFLFIVSLLLLVFMAYVWYIVAALLVTERKVNVRAIFRYFTPLFWRFLLFGIVFFFTFSILALFGIRYITGSFTGYSWVWYVLVILGLLALVQFLRYSFLKKAFSLWK